MGRMAEQQRKLLEQMMGPEAMGVVQLHVDWWDPKVCKNFLCGTCPHLIFTNTKMDLGPCPKLHNDKVKTAFEAARASQPNDNRFSQFEQEYQNNLYAFVEDCDRKIRMSQRRLEKTPEENAKTVNLMKEIGEIELSIQGETEEIEQLGEAGKVEESMKKLEAVEALKLEKADKERELQRLTDTGGASGHQKLRVCETCGAYLSVLDSDRRLADHFGGKMHLGYHELRKLLEGFAEARLARQANGGGYANRPPMQQAPPPANAPSGPAGNRGFVPPPPPPGFPSNGNGNSNGSAPPLPPSTPANPSIDVQMEALEEGAIAPGHGDKRKREAGELVSDVKEERDRSRDRERERNRDDDKDRERRRHRSREDRHRDKDDDRRRDRDRDDRKKDEDRHRSSRSEHRDRDRSDRDRDRDRERERSPRRKA